MGSHPIVPFELISSAKASSNISPVSVLLCYHSHRTVCLNAKSDDIVNWCCFSLFSYILFNTPSLVGRSLHEILVFFSSVVSQNPLIITYLFPNGSRKRLTKDISRFFLLFESDVYQRWQTIIVWQKLFFSVLSWMQWRLPSTYEKLLNVYCLDGCFTNVDSSYHHHHFCSHSTHCRVKQEDLFCCVLRSFFFFR